VSTLRKQHWTTVKRVFRYLCVTKDYVICYRGIHGDDSGKLNVLGFVDIDLAGNLDRWRSTKGYVIKMFGGAIIWSKRHTVVALSTT
jgi:hypothetical protein